MGKSIDTKALVHAAMMADMSDPGDPEHQVSLALLGANVRLTALEAEVQRLLGQVAGLQTDNEVLEKQVSRQRMQIHGARKMIKYGRGARDRLVAENQRLREAVEATLWDTERFLDEIPAFLRSRWRWLEARDIEKGLAKRRDIYMKALAAGGGHE